MHNSTKEIIENVYDKYGGMVYGIALEISPTKKEAQKILTGTFLKLYTQDLLEQNKHCLCATIIRLTIQTAHKILKPGEMEHDFKLKQFKNAHLLHKLLCENVNVQNIYKQHKLTTPELSKKIREEFKEIGNLR